MYIYEMGVRVYDPYIYIYKWVYVYMIRTWNRDRSESGKESCFQNIGNGNNLPKKSGMGISGRAENRNNGVGI